ncbi:MAG TPA: dihydrolipoamide acetyltransferase family protein [Vicinamibacterales bacterium]|nr:dihydrolipoamide acetyltransferase family protein [Vicinamibacterales bacterium]
MSTPVLMPQMGESIAEGTIVRWIKKVGEAVDRDEPLFEISTDKVDAEIPAPAAGVLTEIKVKEGETVAVNSVVATIGAASEVSKQEPSQSASAPAPPSLDSVVPRDADAPPAKPAATSRKTNGRTASKPAEDDSRKQRSSPLVRRIARDNDVDISQIHGSGLGGRVTKNDILGYIDSGVGTRDSGSGTRDSLGAEAPGAKAAGLGAPDSGLGIRDSGGPDPGSRVEIKPLSVMRKKIAEHMVMSRRTSAHVHSVFHVNFSTVERIRQQKKAEYEQLGTKLTYMAFIAKAVVSALRRFPIVNASLDGDNVIYKKDINLGIAVALESGLIVPVIKHADEKNLLGLSRAIADIATRARSKQLKPEEVHDGTFTITNPGQFGSQFGMPIINQPQVAILGVGTIEKRPIVVDDAIAIRTMAYLTLGYDHRLVDGATGDQFMAEVKQQLENFDAV